MDKQATFREEGYVRGGEWPGGFLPREATPARRSANGPASADQAQRDDMSVGRGQGKRRWTQPARANLAANRPARARRAARSETAAGGAAGAAGHAAHFLSRLDRVERDEVDFALGLYRDPELVRTLLARVRLPEGHERAAISLDDPREGPFLVVTRGGHFVTCLGRGMWPGSLPVITRERLEATLTAASDQRARRRAMEERVALAGGSKQLLAALFERSDCLSREEFVAVSAWQPLIAFTSLRLFFQIGADLCERHDALASVAPARRASRALEPTLRRYWKRLWSMGHFLTLATMGDRGWLADFVAHARRSSVEAELSFSWPLVRHGVAPLALRGAWAMGRVGKPMVGHYKGVLASPGERLLQFDAALALGAVGLRNGGARAEIQKVMSSAAARFDFAGAPPTYDTAEDDFAASGSAYAGVVGSLFSQPSEALDAEAVAGGRRALMARFRGPGARGRRPFASSGEIPADVARAALFNADADYVNDPGAALGLLRALGAAGRARAEDFYYPAAVVPFVRPRWRPEVTLEVFDRMGGLPGPSASGPAETKPGRNEPCPCASGRKYKRCCGAGS